MHAAGAPVLMSAMVRIPSARLVLPSDAAPTRTASCTWPRRSAEASPPRTEWLLAPLTQFRGPVRHNRSRQPTSYCSCWYDSEAVVHQYAMRIRSARKRGRCWWPEIVYPGPRGKLSRARVREWPSRAARKRPGLATHESPRTTSSTFNCSGLDPKRTVGVNPSISLR